MEPWAVAAATGFRLVEITKHDESIAGTPHLCFGRIGALTASTYDRPLFRGAGDRDQIGAAGSAPLKNRVHTGQPFRLNVGAGREVVAHRDMPGRCPGPKSLIQHDRGSAAIGKEKVESASVGHISVSKVDHDATPPPQQHNGFALNWRGAPIVPNMPAQALLVARIAGLNDQLSIRATRCREIWLTVSTSRRAVRGEVT